MSNFITHRRVDFLTQKLIWGFNTCHKFKIFLFFWVWVTINITSFCVISQPCSISGAVIQHLELYFLFDTLEISVKQKKACSTGISKKYSFLFDLSLLDAHLTASSSHKLIHCSYSGSLLFIFYCASFKNILRTCFTFIFATRFRKKWYNIVPKKYNDFNIIVGRNTFFSISFYFSLWTAGS